MKTEKQVKNFVDRLQLASKDPVPEEVSLAQDKAFQCFVRGDQVSAYRYMIIILRYYQERKQQLPKPCELLYKTLIVQDFVVDHFVEHGRDFLKRKLHSHRN